jgi:hypothetical protein
VSSHLTYEDRIRALDTDRARLLEHPIYARVNATASLRAFMEAHVFAVWDFMSLLKSLQRRLTCVDIPWTPPRSHTAARLINSIVLAEESDEIAPGVVMSHFALYMKAMREVDADTSAIERLVNAIARGAGVGSAIEEARAPQHVASFVKSTFGFVNDAHVEVTAAAFLIGREDLVPEMFRRLLPEVARDKHLEWMPAYLRRHIEVDEGEHGPLARQLLSELCGSDEAAWSRAIDAGRRALVARRELWDGVIASMPAHAG